MARRSITLSLADVVAIGVSTVLLIGMLCGLTFFILEVAYHGGYLGTLQWVLFFFVIAIVLIARIALTIDQARAIAYGVALALVTALAINKFVEVPKSGILGPATLVVPYALLGIIWWCAHILTKDCTHTEESSDDAGLLDAPPATPPPAETPGTWLKDYEREREAERRRHRPGTWLVYFSLATLPLFILGQLFIPAGAADRRAFAFWMLTLYLGCAVSLLATTSFLGLRRYLEQRRLNMPWKMTGVWLGLSVGLILSILLLAALLPRPYAEYGLGRLWAQSQKQGASDQALVKRSGGEGPGQQGGKGEQGQKPPAGNQGQRDPNADNAPPAPGKQGQGNGGEGGQPKGGQQQGQGQGQQQGQGGQGQNQPQDQPQEQKDGRDPEQERKKNQGGPMRRERQTERERQQDQPRAGAPQADTEADVPENQPEPMSQPSTPDLGTPWWLWIVVLIALAAAAFWYRNELLALLQGLWPQRQPQAAAPAAAPLATFEAEPPRPPPPFATFRNPFEHLSDFASSEEVVRYSFDALQSWAHEQHLGRAPEETPLEFADRLGEERPDLEKPGRRLAEVFAQVSYAQAKVGPKGLALVREFWEALPPPREPVAQA